MLDAGARDRSDGQSARAGRRGGPHARSSPVQPRPAGHRRPAPSSTPGSPPSPRPSISIRPRPASPSRRPASAQTPPVWGRDVDAGGHGRGHRGRPPAGRRTGDRRPCRWPSPPVAPDDHRHRRDGGPLARRPDGGRPGGPGPGQGQLVDPGRDGPLVGHASALGGRELRTRRRHGGRSPAVKALAKKVNTKAVSATFLIGKSGSDRRREGRSRTGGPSNVDETSQAVEAGTARPGRRRRRPEGPDRPGPRGRPARAEHRAGPEVGPAHAPDLLAGPPTTSPVRTTASPRTSRSRRWPSTGPSSLRATGSATGRRSARSPWPRATSSAERSSTATPSRASRSAAGSAPRRRRSSTPPCGPVSRWVPGRTTTTTSAATRRASTRPSSSATAAAPRT